MQHKKRLSCFHKYNMITFGGAKLIAIYCNAKVYMLDGIPATFACNQTC